MVHEKKFEITIDIPMAIRIVGIMNTLPSQPQIDEYLKFFFLSYRNESFYLTEITEKVIDHFDVSLATVSLKYEHSHQQTTSETSCIEQLTNWGCVHLLLNNTIKRTGPNEYQYVAGPKPTFKGKGISKKIINEAMVSVKILKNLGWEPERIILELSQWNDDVIEAAIQRVFEKV